MEENHSRKTTSFKVQPLLMRTVQTLPLVYRYILNSFDLGIKFKFWK